eukprot:Lankesteria_metandrocarpae@DN7110_c0_g1_i1.p1
MVYFGIFLKATVENVESIQLPAEYTFCLDVKHSTGEEVRERVTLSRDVSTEVPNTRASANFLVKWRGTNRHATIVFVNATSKKNMNDRWTSATQSTTPLVILDCRGLDVIGAHMGGTFIVNTSRGKSFADADFADGDWAEFDVDSGQPINVYNATFVVAQVSAP